MVESMKETLMENKKRCDNKLIWVNFIMAICVALIHVVNYNTKQITGGIFTNCCLLELLLFM